MIGRLHVKAAVLATLVLAAPLAIPASAQVGVPDTSVALVVCSSVGLHWMHTLGSGLFYGVGRDAENVVDHLCHGDR